MVFRQSYKHNISSSLIGQTLGLFSRNHQFESHKSQSHWKLTWSLTSGPVGLVEMRVSWCGHSR